MQTHHVNPFAFKRISLTVALKRYPIKTAPVQKPTLPFSPDK
jgi:hypothetical protein